MNDRIRDEIVSYLSDKTDVGEYVKAASELFLEIASEIQTLVQNKSMEKLVDLKSKIQESDDPLIKRSEGDVDLLYKRISELGK